MVAKYKWSRVVGERMCIAKKEGQWARRMALPRNLMLQTRVKTSGTARSNRGKQHDKRHNTQSVRGVEVEFQEVPILGSWFNVVLVKVYPSGNFGFRVFTRTTALGLVTIDTVR